MVTEWLLGVLKPFTFVTVRAADGPRGRRAVKILNLQQTTLVGRSWETLSLLEHRLTVRDQPFKVWEGGIPEPTELSRCTQLRIHAKLISWRCLASRRTVRTFSSETLAPATCRVAKPYGTLGRQFPTRRRMARPRDLVPLGWFASGGVH